MGCLCVCVFVWWVCECCGDEGRGCALELHIRERRSHNARASFEMEFSYILGGGFLKFTSYIHFITITMAS
jgi:hypothetical protein